MTNATNTPDPTARLLGLAASVLFLLALFTGLFAGLAMSGKLLANPGAALASHLNALMGTFLMVSFGWTLPMLRYGRDAKRRLALVFVVTSFANWALTALKATLNVAGIDLVGKPTNDTVFVLLQITVVIPTIVAAVAWLVGFRRATSASVP